MYLCCCYAPCGYLLRVGRSASAAASTTAAIGSSSYNESTDVAGFAQRAIHIPDHGEQLSDIIRCDRDASRLDLFCKRSYFRRHRCGWLKCHCSGISHELLGDWDGYPPGNNWSDPTNASAWNNHVQRIQGYQGGNLRASQGWDTGSHRLSQRERLSVDDHEGTANGR